MIVHCVGRRRLCSLGLVCPEHVDIEGWPTPYVYGDCSETLSALLNCRLIPGVDGRESLVKAKRAFLEAALHVALLDERPVTVFAVVAGEREVPKRVQFGLVYSLPLRP